MKIVQTISERVFWWKKDQRETEDWKLIVCLDKDSHERFSHLKTKIPGFSDKKIIAAALLCLDQKIDRIIKRQAGKRQNSERQ